MSESLHVKVVLCEINYMACGNHDVWESRCIEVAVPGISGARLYLCVRVAACRIMPRCSRGLWRLVVW